ncbi:MAG TPA: PHP-associated domain-containing protein [Candidatus Limnocylindria bacterium]|nr:PHP-associated domain-containing protein [Candidatus Limnocylindria bacterium]
MTVDARPPRGGGSRGKADMHLHTLYSDGTAGVRQLLDHVESTTDLDLIAITDHERIDGALRAREIHAAGGYSFELVVGEEVTTRRGHVLGLFLTERVPALRPLPETIERIHAQGGLAIAAHPLAPLTPSLGRRSLLTLHAEADPARRLDGIELLNPSAAGRARRTARELLNTETLRLAAVGNSDAHVLDGVGSAWTWFPGASAGEYRAAVLRRAVEPDGAYWTGWHNVTVYGRQLVAKARKVRHTLRPTGEWR